MQYEELKRHRHYPKNFTADERHKKQMSAEDLKVLEMADTITCSASGQLTMLARCLEREAESSSVVSAVLDTLEAIAIDLMIAKNAIESATNEREVGQ